MSFSLQIRLDFNTFIISGPSTRTLTAGLILNGNLVQTAGVEVSDSGRCLTDIFTSKFLLRTFYYRNEPSYIQTSNFSVSNQNTVPLICGINTGSHGKY